MDKKMYLYNGHKPLKSKTFVLIDCCLLPKKPKDSKNKDNRLTFLSFWLGRAVGGLGSSPKWQQNIQLSILKKSNSFCLSGGGVNVYCSSFFFFF